MAAHAIRPASTPCCVHSWTLDRGDADRQCRSRPGRAGQPCPAPVIPPPAQSLRSPRMRCGRAGVTDGRHAHSVRACTIDAELDCRTRERHLIRAQWSSSNIVTGWDQCPPRRGCVAGAGGPNVLWLRQRADLNARVAASRGRPQPWRKAHRWRRRPLQRWLGREGRWRWAYRPE